MPYALTSDQEVAKTGLAPLFNQEGEARVGILKGFAGTGKTFLVAHIISGLLERGWDIKVLAPTGRASEVLGREIEKHLPKSDVPVRIEAKTIHSFIYKLKPMDFNVDQLSLFADVKTQDWNGHPTLWIVDESSMVGDQGYRNEEEEKDMRFGSGSLLKDLLDAAELDEANPLRILFVGDPGQLSPIRTLGNESPALDAETLRAWLPVELRRAQLPVVELTEIKRQEEGSLLNFVTDVRLAMQQGDTLPKDPRDKVQPLSESALVSKYLDLTAHGEKPSNAVILSHTNNRVKEFNRRIRKALDRDHRLLHMNDVLLVKRNQRWHDYGELEIGFDGVALRNGSFVQIISVPIEERTTEIKLAKQTIAVQLEFWDARIRTIQGENHIDLDVKILASRLRDSDQNQWLEQALLVDVQRRIKNRFGLTPKSPGDEGYEEYQKKIEGDPYFNALRVAYGYAVTVHNSQGGEWPAVIVDPASNRAREWQNHPEHRQSYARWVYTAVTRAQEEVWCLRPIGEE